MSDDLIPNRPLDHFDSTEDVAPWAEQCFGCDRCEALEQAPREFFRCVSCRETLCDEHAQPIYSESRRTAVCRECYETGGPGAGR